MVKPTLRKVYPWVWVAAYLGLLWWLFDGDRTRLLVGALPGMTVMPAVLIAVGLMALFGALARWRRLESPERILWAANLPARMGGLAAAALLTLVMLPAPATIGLWARDHDFARLAGLVLLLGLVGWVVWLGLRSAIDGVSVTVSAAGIQRLRRLIPWSEIKAIESGFPRLRSGAVIVLADDRIVLSPFQHGPAGRALVAAVQRFSPATQVREPEFQ